MDPPSIDIRVAQAHELPQVRTLFVEYAESLGFSLCFQGFDQEVASLPGEYVEPRGTLLLGWRGVDAVGCVGLRPLDHDIGEIKRLYVRLAARGAGLGRLLVTRVIEHARKMEYRRLRLDTLATMKEAIALYQSLGFREIAPYCHNPIEGARFFELQGLAS